MKFVLTVISFILLIGGLIMLVGGVAGDLFYGKPFEIGTAQMRMAIVGAVILLAGVVLTIANRQSRQLMMSVFVWLKNNLFTNTNRMMVLVVLCYALIYFNWGELIPAEGGFGFDGTIFRQVVKEFPAILIEKTLRQYYVGRMFPSIVVHYALTLLNLPLNDLYILKGFQLLNLIVLVSAAALWGKIADLLSVGKTGKWLGFVGLFINYGVGKYDFYYPPLTDQMAFFLGMLLLFFFLKRKPVGILITAFLGAFTMSTILYTGLILFLFSGEETEDVPPLPVTYRLNGWVAGVYSVVLLVTLVVGNFVLKVYTTVPREPLLPFLYLSIILALVYHFFAFKELLNNGRLFDVHYFMQLLKSQGWWVRLISTIGVFLVCRFIYSSFGTPNEAALSTVGLVQRSLQMSIQLPAIFFLGFVVWYGPIAFLTLFWWKRIVTIINSFGLGLILFIMINVFFSLTADPRYILGAFPFFVAFTVKAGEKLEHANKFFWIVAVVSFLASKIWLWFNVAEPWGDYYIMNWGPWMSNGAYVVQGSIALVIAGILFVSLKWNELTVHLER